MFNVDPARRTLLKLFRSLNMILRVLGDRCGASQPASTCMSFDVLTSVVAWPELGSSEIWILTVEVSFVFGFKLSHQNLQFFCVLEWIQNIRGK